MRTIILSDTTLEHLSELKKDLLTLLNNPESQFYDPELYARLIKESSKDHWLSDAFVFWLSLEFFKQHVSTLKPTEFSVKTV